MAIEIRPLRPEDWGPVRRIYEEGIATGDATFETEAPGWETWDAGHLDACRLVAEGEGRIVGWAALAPVSGRCVYGGVAEVSVYVGGTPAGADSASGSYSARRTYERALWNGTLQRGLPENVSSLPSTSGPPSARGASRALGS